MDQEREAEHVLISSPVRHCILINLTDVSKLELTFTILGLCECFSLSLSRSITCDALSRSQD